MYKCRIVQLKSNFHKDKSTRDGLQPACKSCIKTTTQKILRKIYKKQRIGIKKPGKSESSSEKVS